MGTGLVFASSAESRLPQGRARRKVCDVAPCCGETTIKMYSSNREDLNLVSCCCVSCGIVYTERSMAILQLVIILFGASALVTRSNNARRQPPSRRHVHPSSTSVAGLLTSFLACE